MFPSNIPRCDIVQFGQTESWPRICLNAGTSPGSQQLNIYSSQRDPSFDQVFSLVKEYGFLLSLGDQVTPLFASASKTMSWFTGLVDTLELAPAWPVPHPPLQVQPAVLSAIPASALGANLWWIPFLQQENCCRCPQEILHNSHFQFHCQSVTSTSQLTPT